MLRALLSLSAAFFVIVLPAQDVGGATEVPSPKQVVAIIKEADALAARGGRDVPKALERYAEAFALDPENADLNLKIGLCHLNGPERHRAQAYLERAARLDPALPRVDFLLGYAYQLNARWDEAIERFEAHRLKMLSTPDPDRFYNMADKHIVECRNGASLMASPGRAVVRNLGPAINGPTAEYGAIFAPTGNGIHFTSRRGIGDGRINRTTNEPYEVVHTVEKGPDGWGVPKPLAQVLNSPYNNALVGMADQGRTLLLFRDKKGHGDILVSRAVNDAWSVPEPLPGDVNSTAQEGSAWIAPGGDWIYFSSDRPGGLGGMDLWRSPWDATNSTWGKAENLGPKVNTVHDEDGVFVAADGRTLYFSSKGHTTMGGFDVFRTKLGAQGWSKPENLGWPVNSPDDDLYFVLGADGRTGLLSSTRAEGRGQEDIYEVDMDPVAEQLVASAAGAAVAADDEELVTLRGFVRSLRLMPPIEVRIEVSDPVDGSRVAMVDVDPESGEYQLRFPVGRELAMHVRANGHLLHSVHLAAEQVEPVQDLTLVPVEPGAVEVLRNIHWRNDEAELDHRSEPELLQLLELLRERPDLRLEIGGHTDDRGSEAHNQALSAARAEAVRQYLEAKGVAPDRIRAKGYGSDSPVRTNATEADRAMNRRTEIKVF